MSIESQQPVTIPAPSGAVDEGNAKRTSNEQPVSSVPPFHGVHGKSFTMYFIDAYFAYQRPVEAMTVEAPKLRGGGEEGEV